MHLLFDLQYNLRLMRKTPGFVAICVLMISLGMGLCITLYSISDNMGIKSMPIVDGDRLVKLGGRYTAIPNYEPHPLDGFIFQNVAANAQSYEMLGAYLESAAIVSYGDLANRYQLAYINQNLFEAAGVAPILGRPFQNADTQLDAEPVTVISYPVWQNTFVGRDDVIGQVLRINGKAHTVVGVMPPDFNYPVWYDLWVPLQLPSNVQPHDLRWLTIWGVLKPNVSREYAQREFELLFNRISEQVPETYPNLAVEVYPCCTILGGEPNAVGFVLPILSFALLILVCVNVANLILVRTNQRIHEFAIRSAVGAVRKRLLITVLQDSLLISVFGACLGLVLATLGMAYVKNALIFALSPLTPPYWFDFTWQLNTLLVSLGLTAAIWILSAALALWQVGRQDLSATLALGEKGATDKRGTMGTSLLVSFEMVFSCFLLILSGLAIGMTLNVSKADYGTPVEGYLAGRLFFPTENFSTYQQWRAYQTELTAALENNNGIEAVSFATALPSQYGRTQPFALEDRNLKMGDRYPRQSIVQIANNYFDTMQVELISGRQFDSADNANSLPVVIVDENFAAQYWPGESAMGKRIQLNPETDNAEWLTVVGVIPHIIQRMASDGMNDPSLYRPLAQTCCEFLDEVLADQSFSIVVKVEGNPVDYRQILRTTAGAVNNRVSLLYLQPLANLIEHSNTLIYFAANMSSTLALIALVLAIIGIYAMISRAVRQRAREIGIRRAIGSSNGQVLWVFIRQGLLYLVLGLLVGGGAAAMIADFMDGSVGNLIAWLPLVFFLVSTSLAILVIYATYNPARYLIGMDPGETLRDE